MVKNIYVKDLKLKLEAVKKIQTDNMKQVNSTVFNKKNENYVIKG